MAQPEKLEENLKSEQPKENEKPWLTKWVDAEDTGYDQLTQNKKKELNEIVEAVNNTQMCPTIETNDIIATTDIEGHPNSFLCKLKAAGMIDGVSLDEKIGRLKIKLNENWRGALAFCGDLTSYKGFLSYQTLTEGFLGNDIVIEVFEELLDQLEKHNEPIIKKNNTLPQDQKQEEAKFVAVPGNHEFLRYWAIKDSKALFGDISRGTTVNLIGIQPQKRVLRVKVRAARVLAKIQRYYFKQAQRNGYDINDDDYGDRYGDAFASLTNYIKELDKYIEDCETLLKNIDDKTQWQNISTQLENIGKETRNGDEAFEDWEEKANLGSLDVLKWRNNKLFSKMMLCHRGKKLRLLHSLSLFAPKTIFPDHWQIEEVKKNTEPYCGKYHQLTEAIGNNLNKNIVNMGGVDYKYLPQNVRKNTENNALEYDFDPSAFANNKISTIWGHKGDRKAVSDSKQVCFDGRNSMMCYIDELGIVYQWDEYLEDITILRDQNKQIFQLSMPTAKTTIEAPENAGAGNNNVQNLSDDDARQIINAIIEGKDKELEQWQDLFNQQRIDNEFLVSALQRYNANNHDVIKRYSGWDKFWSLGKNTARKRRINHLGKMLNWCFTRNMTKQEKKQYRKAVNKHNNKMTKLKDKMLKENYDQLKKFLEPLPKYGTKMKKIEFQDLVDIAKIHSRWPCCCCGSDSVEVQP